MSAGQREIMMQKQKLINQMVTKMGDTTEFMDTRGSQDLHLTREETN